MPRTKQFNQEEVLHKAKGLFWKQGFQGTSMQDLVDHLGLHRGSIYDTFGSKTALFDAAFELYRQEGLAVLEEALAKFDSVKAGLKYVLVESLQASLEDDDKKGCFVVNSIGELQPALAHLMDDMIAHKVTFVSIVSASLAKAKLHNELADTLDTEAMATYIFTVFSGLKVVSKITTSKKEINQTIDLALKVLD